MAKSTALVEPGRNCWRIERAEAAAVVVDARDYFKAAIEAFESAQRRVLIIGWDFDTRVDLDPEVRGRYSLGRFFLELAKQNPLRRIEILKWSFGAKKQFFHPKAAWYLWRWARTKAIRFRFDAAHPVGCSHHQKILVIDNCLASCGGIDMALGRWDTPQHRHADPRRKLPSGQLFGPWHDISLFMCGPVAKALGQLGEVRWQRATGEPLGPVRGCENGKLPSTLRVDFADLDIAISRTIAPYGQAEEVREIERLYLDLIAAAKRFIYFENQYFSSARIAQAIAKRLEEPDPPEVVLVMAKNADGWLEQKVMDSARYHLVRAIGRSDHQHRFRIYTPMGAGGQDIYVHAKLAIVDDQVLTLGSANLNNRSMGLDSECNVTIDCALPANGSCGDVIRALRLRLLGEHLDCDPSEVDAAIKAGGSMIAAIEHMRAGSTGKTLSYLDLEEPGLASTFIAENELLDPARPDEFLETLSERRLWKRWVK